MKLFLGLTGVTLALALASACGEDTDATFGGCTPGQSQACAGPAGCDGYQVCAPDGKSFGACDCGSSSSGTGGSTSGTGGTSTSGTAGGGGTSTSGTAGGGGSSSGAGGQGGGNPTGCPPQQPQEDDPCNDWQLTCEYGSFTCECGYNGWSCYECPTQEPQDGDPCQGLQGAECTYGDVECSCQGYQTPDWSCVTCPSTQPQDGDPCQDQGAFCEYGNTNCVCGYNQEWNCW